MRNEGGTIIYILSDEKKTNGNFVENEIEKKKLNW